MFDKNAFFWARLCRLQLHAYCIRVGWDLFCLPVEKKLGECDRLSHGRSVDALFSDFAVNYVHCSLRGHDSRYSTS